MSSTRLLILGVIRIMQPVHGYDVRRELLSWRADSWGNVAPGSIYSQLKTLQRDGLIRVTGTEQAGSRPERTEYEVTGEGEKEFKVLLHENWRRFKSPALPLGPAITMFPFYNRAEMIDSLEGRIKQLEVEVADLEATDRLIGGNPADGGIPEHVREMNRLITLHLGAEMQWTREFKARLEKGEHWFADEGPPPWVDKDCL